MDAHLIAKALIQGFENFRAGFNNFTASGKDQFISSQWAELRMFMQHRIRHNETCIDEGSAIISGVPPENATWKVITSSYLNYFFLDNWQPLAVSYLNACLRQAYAEYSFPFIVLLPSLSAYQVKLLHIPVENDIGKALRKAINMNGALPVSNADSALIQIVDILCKDGSQPIDTIEFFPELFYRNQHAYSVGRIKTRQTVKPLAFAYTNTDNVIVLNACMLTENELLNIFSFSRSYFLVNTESPVGLINFLGSIMPNKPKAQLLINLGFQELGKDLLLQRFNVNLHNSEKKISYAPGIAGMVMIVFQHPDAEYVFKIVRSRSKPPKTTTENEVTEKYRFVAGQDRVGRMADVQLFKNLALPVDSFEEKLMQELLGEASGGAVRIEKGYFIFRNIFVERKLLPLNLFLQEHDDKENEEVIIDYGNAIKEMAMTNIFPGDMLIKNFGVSDKKRVIFYDYDEVMPITQCTFKTLRQPGSYDEELASEYPEPVFDGDIFPEELYRFLVPQGRLRDVFDVYHSDLYSIEFWDHWKSLHESGLLIDIQPYESNIK